MNNSKKELAFKEFELGEKSGCWDKVNGKIDLYKLAKTIGVYRTTPCHYWNQWIKGRTNTTEIKPSIKSDHDTTKQQKEHALKIFSMGKNSLLWNDKLGRFDIMSMRKSVGVSEWTLRYWLALWNHNHNTNLEYVPSTGEELERNKSMYF